jgi:hypothetical protein
MFFLRGLSIRALSRILGGIVIVFAAAALAGCDKPKSSGSGGDNGVSAPVDHWTYEESVDQISHDTTYKATREIALDNGGTAEMTAECMKRSSLFAQLMYMRIRIAFFDKDGKPLDLEATNFDKDGNGTLRATFKDGVEDSLGAQIIHTNEIGIDAAVGKMEIVGQSFQGTEAHGIRFAQADFAKVEIPLLDGEKPVIDLLPQDPDLHKVLVTCLPEVEPKPAAPQTNSSTAPAPDQPPRASDTTPAPSTETPPASPQPDSSSTPSTTEPTPDRQQQSGGNDTGGEAPSQDSPH